MDLGCLRRMKMTGEHSSIVYLQNLIIVVIQWFYQPTVLTVALMQQCCVCLSSVVVVTLRIVAKRCVLEQKLLLTAYRKSYMRNRLVAQNDLCLKIV